MSTTTGGDYHVSIGGEVRGPFSMEELQQEFAAGRVQLDDYVLGGESPDWQPLASVFQMEAEAPSEPSESSARTTSGVRESIASRAQRDGIDRKAAAADVLETPRTGAPGWLALLRWSWNRLWADLVDHPVRLGACFMGIGIVAFLLSKWPAALWLPCFAVALAAAASLLGQWRILSGAALLVLAVGIPLSLGLAPRVVSKLARAAGLEPAIVSTSSDFVPTDTAPLAPVTAAAQAPAGVSASPTAVASAPAAPVSTAAPVVASIPPGSAATLPAVPTPLPAANPAPATPASTMPAASANASATTVASLPPTAPVAGASPAAPATLASTMPATSSSRPAVPFDPTVPPWMRPATPNPPAPAPEIVPGSVDGGDLVRLHRASLVLVSGKQGSGSGFLARLEGKPWLFTNIHVTAGMLGMQFSRIDGSRVPPGPAEAAAGRDLMRLSTTEAAAPTLEVISDLETKARIGDEVVVPGNSGGGGVITSLKGTIVGIGPDRIEVNAPFIPGNSGSPVIHVPTGKVIGIATYLTKRYDEFADDKTPRPAGSPKKPEMVVRRFAYRVDGVRRWEAVNWEQFQSEAAQLKQISELTEDIFDFLGALGNKKNPDINTPTLQRPANEWLNTIRRPTISDADRTRATQSFLNSLRSMVRRDVIDAESRVRYTFFREDLKREREVRDKLYKTFDDNAKQLASPSMRSNY